MMHKAWCSIEDVPYCFPRSSIEFQGNTGQNIANFNLNWSFRTVTPVSNSMDGIEMMHNAWHSIEEVPIVFRGHPSNFKRKNQWFESNLRLLGQSQLSNPSDLPCYGLSVLNELKWSNGRKLDSSATVMVHVFAWHLLSSIPLPISMLIFCQLLLSWLISVIIE